MSQHDLVLVRHGETAWSLSGQHTGVTDIELTDHGREQAASLPDLLGGRTFARVLVSPLGRARETCRIAGCADQAEVVEDLREWDYGEYEGRTTADIRTTVPGWSVWTGPLPGGETLDEVAARADRVIAAAREADGDVALFAHGHILRILTARWCELAPIEGRRFPLDTATLSELGWEHEYRTVRSWNAR